MGMSVRKVLAAAVIVLAAGCAVWWYQQRQAEENSPLKAYGFVDVRESALSFETSGRIRELSADEGDTVQQGQVMAMLDTKDLQHQKSIKEASCKVLQSNLSKLEGGYRPELVEQARAAVAEDQAVLKLREATYRRMLSLYQSKSVSAQDKDDALYAFRQAQSSLENAQALLLQYEHGYEKDDIEAARAQLQGCLQEVSYLTYKIEEQSVLRAPFAGYVRSRLQELGAMTSPSAAVFYLSDTAVKNVRFYVTEVPVSLLHPGDKVKVTTTAGGSLDAVVTAVSESAMFTPKNVQTEELRPELVYEVTAEGADPDSVLRLGQAVTVQLPSDLMQRQAHRQEQ